MMILIHKKNKSNVTSFFNLKNHNKYLLNSFIKSFWKQKKTYLSFWNCWAGEANTDILHKFSVMFSAITEMIVYFFWREKLSVVSKWISDKSKKICQIVTVESSNFWVSDNRIFSVISKHWLDCLLFLTGKKTGVSTAFQH